MPPFHRHIFICTNHRDPEHPRGCCDPGNAGELYRLFKTAAARRGLKGTIRANKAGCMDQCEHGPTVVVYPEGVWYGGITKDDIDEILDKHIIGGEPVERLRIADECLNAERCAHKPRKPSDCIRVDLERRI